MGRYLTTRALEGLREYAYKPSGYTVLDAWHAPILNHITNHWLPMWLAPNLITLLGLSALLLSYAMAAAHQPDFSGFAPLWLYASSAFAVFFYLHMDNLDGKQARRTKNSSPLGQLFDHGCDALAVHLILMNVACSLSFGSGWRLTASCLCVMVPWVLAHWEEYHTGEMVYGNGMIGVTEANYAVVFLHLLTWAMRPQRWLAHPFARLAGCSLAQQLPRPVTAFLAALKLNEAVVLFICSMAMMLSYQQVVRVFRLAGSKQLEHTTLPKREQGHKQLGRRHAAAHLLQLVATFVLGAALMSMPPAGPSGARVAMGTFGIVFALQATRLIMAHMCKEPFRVAVWPLVAMAVQVANYFFRWLDVETLSYSVNAVVIAGYLHYVVCVINEICAFLNIPCLTIRKVAE
ncbi:hypothetical protein ABPG77_000476 [Micractinium sp. CCAP 211/92]